MDGKTKTPRPRMGRRDESIISRCHPCSPARVEPAHSTGTRRQKTPDTPRPDNGGVSGGYYCRKVKVKRRKVKVCSCGLKLFAFCLFPFAFTWFAPQLPGPFRACACAGFTPYRRLSEQRRVRVLFLIVVVTFCNWAEYSRASVRCQFGRKAYLHRIAIWSSTKLQARSQPACRPAYA